MEDTNESLTEGSSPKQEAEEKLCENREEEGSTSDETETLQSKEKSNISPDASKESVESDQTETAIPVTKDSTIQAERNEEGIKENLKSVAADEAITTVGDKDTETNTFKKPQQPTVHNDFGDYAEHVSYKEDGTAIYTDPKTKYQYKWSQEEKNWIPCASAADGNENPFENEHYRWCSETQSWKPKATQVTETEHYKWDAEKNAWIPKQSEQSEGITYAVDEDGQRIYTDKDGAVYFWDEEKNAWFPKIDEDFMARYQMSYGFIDISEEEKKKEAEEEQRKAEELKRMTEEARAAMDATSGTSVASTALKRKTQEPPKWFEMDAAHNTKVYVSNLPLDITLDEFAELMGKCGMILRDTQTQKYKLKLYTEADGQIKGDGLCDYIKVESVNLALKILDEYVYRGHKIRVQPAKFEMRGEYNPALKPKRKKKDKEKLQKMKERLFDWRPEKMRGERTKNEKVVIIKNLFTPDIFEKEVQLILDYQNDLREECAKCGTVRKVIIYDCHPEGVAQINMASPEEADLVIQMMNGRYFGKRQLSADHWDGKTKFKIAESEKEAQERLSNWDKFLEADAEKANEKSC